MTVAAIATFFNLSPIGPRFIAHIYYNNEAFPMYFTGATDAEAHAQSLSARRVARATTTESEK